MKRGGFSLDRMFCTIAEGTHWGCDALVTSHRITRPGGRVPGVLLLFAANALMRAGGTAASALLLALTVTPLVHAEIRRDIEYGQAGGERLLLDVNVPDGPGPFPVAILVHGGGWSAGDKSGSNKPGDSADVTPWFSPLTAANFTWFSINYRLAPRDRWPAGLDDVQSAIRWVKAHAGDFKGDASRIALFGHSAGGHLAVYAATIAGEDTRVQAVVGCAAVTDLESDSERRGGLSTSLQNLFGLPPPITPEARKTLREFSPIQHVHAGMPPVLLVHGDADKTVPIGQSQALQTRLRDAGVPCDLMILPGAPHRLLEWSKADPEWMAKVIAWLKGNLGQAPTPLGDDAHQKAGSGVPALPSPALPSSQSSR
jgi:acetyl esterase/lipase